VRRNPYIDSWENDRQAEIKQLTEAGKIPVEHDIDSRGDDLDDETMDQARPFLMGKVAAVVNERKSAKVIVDEMINEAVQCIRAGNSAIISKSML